MKFSYLVLAISLAAAPALAEEATTAAADSTSAAQPIVTINNNSGASSTSGATQTTSQTQAQEAIAQPTTVVEASPVVESKAEAMRKARQAAEMNTEAKIVEKLEESRLQEEQKRAERLFGDKIENKAEATATVVAPVVAAPVVTEVKEEKPAQVTIEKVEIVQPAPAAPAAVIVTDAPVAPAPKGEKRMYVSFGLGNSAYDVSNVDSSYSLSAAFGMLMPSRVAVEATLGYSNHNVDTYWQHPIYAEVDQYDLGVGAKYYILGNTIRPYVGGQLVYVYRQYTDRDYWCTGCTSSESENTYAVNVGPDIGLDFALSEQFSIGADFKYNFNFINKKEINYAAYNLPADTQPLEEVDYYTFQITGKFTF